MAKTLKEIIEEEGRADDYVESTLLEMERAGLVQPNEDGTITVKGTRDELMKYGLDPDAFMHNTEEERLAELAAKYASGEDDLFLCHDPEGGGPLMFPGKIWREANASGQHYVKFTEEELHKWREDEGAKASVRLITGWQPDKGLSGMVASEDLREEIIRSEREIKDVDKRVSALHQQMIYYGEIVLRAEEAKGKSSWTTQELVEAFNLPGEGAARTIDAMVTNGALHMRQTIAGGYEYFLPPARFAAPPVRAQAFADVNGVGR